MHPKNLISVGNIIMYKSTKEIAVVVNINEEFITVKWLNSPSASREEEFSTSWFLPYIKVVAQ
jgi:hypothetical protein